jgi:hypothetical protein
MNGSRQQKQATKAHQEDSQRKATTAAADSNNLPKE